MKYIACDNLHSRLKKFSYGKHHKGNEQLSIRIGELDNLKLKLSANQMLLFCHYFSILIGESARLLCINRRQFMI